MEKRLDLSDKEKLLKTYIERLTSGEALETVQADFTKNFSDVSAIEIARAEQTLLKEGTPLNEVQRLCDVHSALFHGATKAERITNAEQEVARTVKEDLHQYVKAFGSGVSEKMTAYRKEKGHPLQVLSLENAAIGSLVVQLESMLQSGNTVSEMKEELQKLRTISAHYGKKDELLFPLLKEKYGFPGPSDVMWGVEDEIIGELRSIILADTPDQKDRLSAVLRRIREMIYKEENILYPLCAAHFTEEEWVLIAKDSLKFGTCMIAEMPVWDKTREEKKLIGQRRNQSKIILPGGSMDYEQLRSMLNTLPMEITLIDENDVNLFFNEGEKLFIRPAMALGRSVYSCHPKRVEPMVRMLIHDFKTGKKDSLHMLSEKTGKQVLIHYYALRNEQRRYLGTLEAVQEIDAIAQAIKMGKKGPIQI